MKRSSGQHAGAFTLFEVLLVVGMMAVISAITMPTIFARMKREQLSMSAGQLRSFLTLVRANAQFDGKRYRLRFLTDDELDEEEFEWMGDGRQPLVEREDDPFEEPGVYNAVTLPWAVGDTLLGKVWCVEVRLGKPTMADIRERMDEALDDTEDTLIEAIKDIDPRRPPLTIEPDGTCEWATFVLTEAPCDIEFDELEDEVRIEVILDGMTGLSWLQRPFYEEEVDLFLEKGWPAVLRQDFLDPRVLDEDDVLELHESRISNGASTGQFGSYAP